MSINLTVGGNSSNIRRGKMILSDLENIKKSERDHRRRLRSEQVREQSKALSKRILERTRQIQQDELTRLEQDVNTEMRRAHDKKLMELHRRYQDIENIGYAHQNALKQPNVEEIRKTTEEKNKALAKARGLDAMQHLQESNKVVSPCTTRQQRLLNVRNLEDKRSCMVSQLPKKYYAAKNKVLESLDNESIAKNASKRRVKCIVSKKSPVKKIKEIKVQSSLKRTPVSACNEGINEISSTLITTTDKCKTTSPNICKTVSDTVKEESKTKICESDDNEPRRNVPVTSSVPNKPEKIFRYNKENYQNQTSSDLSSTCTTSSSSVSDDSSYFSDTAYKASTIKKAPFHQVSPVNSKIDLYDHKTRQRNSYDRPSGLVERINVKNKPRAQDLAQEMIQLECKNSEILANQKKNVQQLTQDALLREKIRRDYQALLKNLDLLSKEERKLKANQVSDNANEPISHPTKNTEDHTRRQKKMDRVFQNILRSSQEPTTKDNWTERPITITPRNYIHSESIPGSVWKTPSYTNEKRCEENYSGNDDYDDDNDDDCTRKRKISELLFKIEKLKKRLLQEYGADLPDDVFNASVKSLFNRTNVPSQQQTYNSAPKPAAPEIQVINMSSCEEAAKPRKIFGQVKKPTGIQASAKCVPKATCENPVSTRDQQVQVQIEPTKTKEETVPNPLEPTITVLPSNCTDSSTTSMCSDSSIATDVVVGINKKEIRVIPRKKDSNTRLKGGASTTCVKSKRYTMNKTPVKISFEQKCGSSSFEVAGLLIDADKKKITILPRKKKMTSKNVSTPPGKSHSLPGSRDNSPSRKGSKSAPPSQQSSPKKSPPFGDPCRKPTKVADKLESSTEEQNSRFRTQYTQVSIDSSTESSLLNYTSTGTGTATGTGRLYRSFQSLTSKHTITKMQDSSDASTTYASPPPVIPGSLLKNICRRTPILDLLNNSFNDKIHRQVSPVSSPETPSPRTMRLPSNVCRSDRVNKSLKFGSFLDKQTKSTGFSSSSAKSNPSTNCPIFDDASPIQTKRSSTIPCSDTCTCDNPSCKLYHEKSRVTRSFGLNDCPEILEKFEDLKNDCTERIASLTDSIQKLRDEQKGLELSVAMNEEPNPVSKMISSSQVSGSYETSRLVNSIEAIHAQLKKKLMESRKIISGDGIKISRSPEQSCSIAEKSPSISIELSKDTSTSESLEEDGSKAKETPIPTFVASNKPKIVDSKRVNLKLDRFQLGQTSKHLGGPRESKPTLTTATSEANTGAASNPPDRNEETVEMLSKEILEQSKSINKSVAVDSLKDSDDCILKPSEPLIEEAGESSKNTPPNKDYNQSINFDTSLSEYVPFLAGIPKIPRTLPKNSAIGRGRPPITIISAPYRTEIDSPAHELSTIVEFDTPDTGNKSQLSSRSPSNRCRRKLPTKEASQSSTSSPSKATTSSPSKATDVKLTKCKPSVHVAPLLAYRSPQRSHLNLSNRSALKNIEKSPRKSLEKSLESLKNRKGPKSEAKKINSSDSLHTLPDVHIEQLQQSQDNADGNNEFRISEISELHSLPDENIDRLLISDLQEESKSQSAMNVPKQVRDKDNSTSFSGLSGVSEITSTPTSDLNLFKYPSSPEEMELALKKWGLGWAIPTLKKTREASALGSSSSSDVTPVNNAARLVSPVKKQQETTTHDLPMISDVSSISIKHANKSTEKSVLIKGRTSTPNKMSNTNSDDTISTLESFSSDLNIVVQNQSAEITVPNISFSNEKFA